MSAAQLPHQTRKPQKRKASVPPAVPAERVREMLREIAFVLHATRVVGRMRDPGTAMK